MVCTNSGLVIAADYTHVYCWDVATGNIRWTHEFMDYVSGLAGANITTIACDKTGSALVVCATREASLIDTETGNLVGAVPFEVEGSVTEGQVSCNMLVTCDVRDKTALMGLTVSSLDYSESKAWLVRCDFGSGECKSMPLDAYYVERVGLFDGDVTLAVCSSRKDGKALFDLGVRVHKRTVARVDMGAGAVMWQRELEAMQPVVGDELMVGRVVGEDGAERDAVVYCFSNVCEVMDAGTGERVNHRETSASYVMAWLEEPNSVYGVLANGTYSGALLNSAEGTTEERAGLFTNSVAGVRFEGGVLLARDNTLFRYADKLFDEEMRVISPWTAGPLLSTAHGIVVADVGLGENNSVRCQKLDCVGGGVVWEQMLETPYNGGSWDYLGQDEETGSLFFSYKTMWPADANGETNKLAVVSAADGSVKRYDITATALDWNGSDCVLQPFAPIGGRWAGAVRWVDDQSGCQLLLTDLLKGETRGVAVGSALAPDEASCYEIMQTYQYVNPLGSKVLLAYEGLDEPVGRGFFQIGSTAWRCALVDVESGQVTKLEEPVQYDVGGSSFVSWSEDGSLVACIGSSGLLVFDMQGKVVQRIERDSWVPLSVHFADGKLLVVGDEEYHTVLRIYSLEDGEELQSIRLANEPYGMSKGYISSYLAEEEPRWIRSVGKGSDHDRDPGDLC
ncbi:MAG: PQQ-binding-like beta-propeller repeat protein, partial [Coriobacteriales bacterium]|nr:PQQ-binding-like beta-propeller repeat protein [Coriobacteriales bacterium]